MINFLNDIWILLYEDIWLDRRTYKDLLTDVFILKDFGSISLVTIICSTILLFLFYKFWDPVEGQRKKWLLTLVINSFFVFGISLIVLYNNQKMLQSIRGYNGIGPDPSSFVFKVAAINGVYALIFAFLLCILPLPVKFFSNDNKHNPF